MSTAALRLRRLAAHDPTELFIVAIGLVILWQLPAFLLVVPIGLVSIGIERVIPFRRGQKVLRSGWRTDLYHAVVTRGGTALLVTIIVLALGRARDGALPFLGWFHAQPSLLQGAEALLLADLAAYAEHRLSHRLPLLWRFHSVHHSTEEMDWASGYRQHPVDVSLISLAFLTPFIVLNTPWALAAYALFDVINAPWAHANIKASLGPFWWVVRNPELHRWHHAKERVAGNRNFALVLPIWDVIFRTAYLPRDRELKNMGIPGGMSSDYMAQIVGPFRSQRAPVKQTPR